MLSGRREVRSRSDVNYYTARKLEDMARSMERLAKAFDEGMHKTGSLTRDDLNCVCYADFRIHGVPGLQPMRYLCRE